MATQNATNPDTLITVKVAINGSNRRFKLALRDLGANVFSQRLRFLLAIPPSQNVLFERYSDSAAAYIVLDENNPSVYKQLYRAAKAKLKLRIKATLAEDSNNGEQSSAQSSSPPPNTSNFYQAPPAYTSRLSLQSINGIPRPVEPPVASAAAAFTSDPLNLLPKDILMPSVKEVVENDMRRQRASEYNIQDRETMLRTIRKLRSNGTLDEMDKKLSPPSSAAGQNSNAKNVEEQGAYRDSLMALQRIMQARREMAIRTKPETAAPSSTPAQPAPQAKSYSGPYVCGFSQANNFRSYPHLNSYAIYCNACDIPIPDAHHFHCSVCEGGDFDLCQNCVDKGVHCGSEEHWLIKRIMKDGKVINSTTENIEPKNMKSEATAKDETHTQEKIPEEERTRTCNCCVEVFPETNFVTCTTCPDYDLCIPCHVGMTHGHYPRHGFKPATEDAKLDLLATLLLKPGRNIQHYAICDGCDKSIYGVRHKCLNCPDWDYCSNCIQNARFIHPGHRFVPIYEPINTPTPWNSRHNGIFCDGPLCQAKGARSYIVGDRYKCAVCHDTDFCANCEASPTNKHNRTHPLIKFKTPIKNVTVTTLGEKENGEEMLTMGDAHARTRSTATETTPAANSSNAATQVQTVADLKPSEEPVVKEEPKPTFTQPPPPSYETAAELQATFVSDVVADGSKLPPNHVFKQTWRLLNPGPGSWPAGCSVKFVGGDNMLALDPQHVSSLIDLGNAAESNTLDRVVPAGDEAEFTVSMRTPSREGKCISYWRLTGFNGMKFGHKLWCDVDVCQTLPTEPVETKHVEDLAKETSLEEPNSMIFPKLEKESPIASQHESAPVTEGAGAAFSALEQLRKEEQEEILSDIASLDEDDDDDDISFLTDDEYDVLDASDEDFLTEAQNGLKN